jgi:hypothetical protein
MLGPSTWGALLFTPPYSPTRGPSSIGRHGKTDVEVEIPKEARRTCTAFVLHNSLCCSIILHTLHKYCPACVCCVKGIKMIIHERYLDKRNVICDMRSFKIKFFIEGNLSVTPLRQRFSSALIPYCKQPKCSNSTQSSINPNVDWDNDME